ncbi:hypothetical protein FACS1894217_03890 [Clostridia bacterium]|nr:hypothetical protein FACS1894217_03890 [Clostridia bacterium]
MLQFYLSALDTEAERQKMSDIYERYRSRYIYIAMKALNDHARAEDAVHAAFVDMLAQKEKIFALSCSDFLRYSDCIVSNKSLDILRREKKHVEIYDDMPDDTDVGDIVLRNMNIEKLMAVLDTLGDDEQRILRSKYIFKRSYQDIAAEMGLTLKNVEIRLYRVRQKVKRILIEEGITCD